MARYSISARTTNAPTSTLPGISLYANTNTGFRLREFHVYNTTATECTLALARFTTAGTQGSGLTEAEWNPNGTPPLCTGFQSHTSTPPTLGDELIRAKLGAAIGSGVMWTFDVEPIECTLGTANGIGLISVGTGQIVDCTIVWEE